MNSGSISIQTHRQRSRPRAWKRHTNMRYRKLPQKLALWLLIHLQLYSPIGANSSFPYAGIACASDCTLRGNCNIEEGRCECPFGFEGEIAAKIVSTLHPTYACKIHCINVAKSRIPERNWTAFKHTCSCDNVLQFNSCAPDASMDISIDGYL